ncbi:hypothetical protein JRO89_XS02G0114500 [Xanthoceras sorbifolium]|uniref:BURP domain-containing protein n=1 Tax=Xanthoceras sorbifolium TaxID=99658 RepID=A0ABQ8IFM1_9ROSI|nr:hypothetical protein JRO89_XS02G0114500 [Xanthoceras sorbifolium]
MYLLSRRRLTETGSTFSKSRKMGSGFASWNLLLLLLVMCACRCGARDLYHGMYDHQRSQANNLDGHDDGHQELVHTKEVRAHNPSSSHVHHNNMDFSSMIFFTLNDLKVGRNMDVYFQERDPSVSPPFLPREEADSIPFSLNKLHYLLEFFSLQPDSPRAKAIEHTLRNCEIAPMEGETKLCATSLESMLDFAHEILGLDSDIEVLSTTHLRNSRSIYQNYTVLEAPKELQAPNFVACHSMAYPYAIFYCHSLENENKVFKISLAGDNGDRLEEALAICHMDTSNWNPNHAAFHILGIKPGSHVCHFFPAENLVFIPASASTSNMM